MKLATLLAAAALLAVNPLHVGDTANRSQYDQVDVQNLQRLANKATEPPVTPVVPGSVAPDFSYQTPDNEWHHLHDLLEQGPVLMLFGGRDPQFTALENEREQLLDLGVLPVAIVDGHARAASAAVKRLGLAYNVIPDPQGVIAGLFNAVEPRTDATQPCWFVIDRQRRVRALDRTGLPEQGYADIAIEALALPKKGTSLPVSH